MTRVGAGITLIIVGAILAFAVRADIPGLGEYALGLILMLGGILLLVFHFVFLNQYRRRDTVVERRDTYARDPYVEDEIVEEEPVVRRRRRRLY